VKKAVLVVFAVLALAGCKDRVIWNDNGKVEEATTDREVWDSNHTAIDSTNGATQVWNEAGATDDIVGTDDDDNAHTFSGTAWTYFDGLGWDSNWLYFSFVTMTTLGYGDILPVSATARGLAYMQAIVGQFYIAVLVAGLVGAYVSTKSSDN